MTKTSPEEGIALIAHICDMRSEPTDEMECWEVVWSKGKSCKKCYAKCFRKGWPQKDVLADNKKRVEAKQKSLLDNS